MPNTRRTIAHRDGIVSRHGGTRRERPAPTSLALVAAAVAVLGLSACGASVDVSTTKTIDIDQVKAAIVEQYAAQQVTLTRLDCKDDVEAKAGAPIACSGVNSKGTTLDIRGTVTDASGDGGRFRVRTVSAVAKGTIIADRARAELEKKVGQKARSLTCPATIPIPTTPSVTCELTALDGSKLDVKLTLDAKASFSLEVADQLKSGPTG